MAKELRQAHAPVLDGLEAGVVSLGPGDRKVEQEAEEAAYKASVAKATDAAAAVSLEYAMHEISCADLQMLRDLSGKAGGWWTYRRFVPMDEWVAEFKAHEASGAEEDR